VADAWGPGIDKACGEGLMPDSVEALGALGVTVPREAGHPFPGLRFLGSGISVDARFPSGTGLGVRRTVLHDLLSVEAARSGVEMLWKTRVVGLKAGQVECEGRSFQARWIVGADGGQSSVRRWAGLDACRRDEHRYGFRRHYGIAPWSEFMELYWSADDQHEACQIYVTPVGPQEVCVAVLSRNPQLRLDQALPRFPRLAERLSDAPATSQERGSITASRQLRSVSTERIALVGDASGSVDAITGEGLCLTFHQAHALARHLEAAQSSGTLDGYEAEHRRLRRRPAFMADLLLLMGRRNWLRRRTLNVFSAQRNVFSGMLAMHVGALPPASFAANCLALGWGLLTQA
jgi:2-polyprenyl-6-methoxyphenol hydroxylase-like FAD-dependent oxidoreductase